MPMQTFSYEGIRIGIEAEHDSDQRWLREFLAPWFDTGGGAADIGVRITVDPRRYAELQRGGAAPGEVDAFMMDTHVIRYPRWHGPDGRMTLHDEQQALFFQCGERGIDIVSRERDPRARLRIMRVVRELAMGAAQASGGRFLHAAAVAIDGRALVMLGRREAGKTSLLTYLLSRLDARFLTNDRLLALPDGAGVRLRGMPTIVSIRDGTLDFFPGLRRALQTRGYTSRLALAECRDGADVATERRGLSPAQYCALLERTPVRNARAAALLFPRLSGRPGGLRVEPLDRDGTMAMLRQGLFSCIGPEHLSGVFTLPRHRRRASTAMTDTALLAWLGDTVPGYVCHLGTDVYASADAARALQRLLDAQPITG